MNTSVTSDQQATPANLSRFRPEDASDFSRRAKSLAKVLDAPLQDAQELLAQAYGYEHRYELQQVLKTTGVPGPYDDYLAEAVDRAKPDAAAEFRFDRESRLMRIVGRWALAQEHRQRTSHDALACDLGLFHSPAAHRVRARDVLELSEDDTAPSKDGFPYGFRGTLHLRYQLAWNWAPTAEQAFREVQSEFRWGVFHPEEQLQLLQRYRAPHLFVAMLSETRPDLLEGPFQVSLGPYDLVDSRHTRLTRLLQSDMDDLITSHLLDLYRKRTGLELDDAEIENLRTVLLEPTAARIKTCPAVQGVPDFEKTLTEWRMDLRIQFARTYVEGDPDDVSSDYAPRKPPAFFEFGLEDYRLTVLLRPIETFIDIRRWDVCATLMLRDEQSLKWTVGGVLTGDYLLPTDNNHYESANSVLSYFDDQGNRELYRVWNALQSLYLDLAGFADYGDWVNNPDGAAVANLHPWVMPAYRGSDASRHLFQSFTTLFEDLDAESWDAYWREWTNPFDDEKCADREDDEYYDAVSVVFVPLPGTGVLGHSIWQGPVNQAIGRLVRQGGERVYRETRAERRHGLVEDVARSGIGWSMLDTVKTIDCDFVFYDPDEAA